LEKKKEQEAKELLLYPEKVLVNQEERAWVEGLDSVIRDWSRVFNTARAKAREREMTSSLNSLTISFVRGNRPVPQRFLLVRNVIVPDRKMTSSSAYFAATVH
jgi:hypothetical protein